MGALAKQAAVTAAGPEAGAAIAIDGRIVLVDLDVGRLKGKVPCVVVRTDGSIGIEKVWNGLKLPLLGSRSGYYDAPNGISWVCTIIGKLIEAA